MKTQEDTREDTESCIVVEPVLEMSSTGQILDAELYNTLPVSEGRHDVSQDDYHDVPRLPHTPVSYSSAVLHRSKF